MSMPTPPGDAWTRIAQLEHENAKLKKINKVLIDRVERSMDFQGNAYSLFQTAIVLEGQVRERTGELESALRELGKTNRDLRIAKEEAETARARLATAIESISEGFVLCDANDRLVMCNNKYREFWPGLADLIRPGVPFTALFQRAQSLGLFDSEKVSGEISLQQRLDYHQRPQGLLVLKLNDGRWLQINERPTADGGSVAIYTDITGIKLSEQRQRERELAVKNTLLHAIFNNITQGILVVDHERRLVAWNDRFLDLLGIARDGLAIGQDLHDFIHVPAIHCQFVHFGFETAPIHFETFCTEQICADGRVLEIRMGPMPGGGIVTTYTDITERKRSEWALRDSEYRTRLITDTIPALIAYVDATQHYRFTNKPHEEWFGRPRGEITGRHMREVLGEELYEARRDHVEAALSGQPTTFEIDLSTAGSNIRCALATYIPHFGSDGSVLGFFALIQDITERKQAASQLREAKENLERRVAERTAELTALNQKLKQEVDERRQTEEALQLAKVAADQANMSKTKFIAAASHDLLQPLNAARVFAAALSESRMSERNRSLVTNLTLALNAVDDLLNALLDISKFDAGAHTPEISDFYLDTVLASLAEEHAPQAATHQLALRWVPCSAVVRTDPMLISRVLRNFLSNAMRYTPSGRILMGCRRRPDGVEVQVWDSGIGIPDDKVSVIFEEFRRLNSGGAERDRGMGLGLAIVERITRRLGHRVIVRSRLGQGSVFGVLLPYGTSVQVKSQAASPDLAAAVDRVADTAVLIIENDPDELAGMTALLRSWRCEVASAEHLEAAQFHLRRLGKPPQIVLADYQLDNDQTGLQALTAIQSLYQQPIPGIVITADRSEEVLSAVRAAGYHLLNKPLKPARLRSLLAHLVAGDRQQMTPGSAGVPPASHDHLAGEDARAPRAP